MFQIQLWCNNVVPRILYSHRGFSKIPTFQEVLTNIEKKNSPVTSEVLLSSLRESVAKKLNDVHSSTQLLEYHWYECKCNDAMKIDIFRKLQKEMESKGFALQRQEIVSDSRFEYISLRCLSPAQVQQEAEEQSIAAEKQNDQDLKTGLLATGQYLGTVTVGVVTIVGLLYFFLRI